MSAIQELEAAVTQLTPEELADFRAWFAEYEARAAAFAAERTEWFQFAAHAINAAYGDDEPEYTAADVKVPNPAYDGR